MNRINSPDEDKRYWNFMLGLLCLCLVCFLGLIAILHVSECWNPEPWMTTQEYSGKVLADNHKD